MEELAAFRWPSGSPNVQFRVFDPNLQDRKPTFGTLTRRLGTCFFSPGVILQVQALNLPFFAGGKAERCGFHLARLEFGVSVGSP